MLRRRSPGALPQHCPCSRSSRGASRTSSLALQVHDLSVHVAASDPQLTHTDREPEASRPGAARIEVQDPMLYFLLRHVAVTVDDHPKTCRLRLQVEFSKDVQDIDRHAVYFERIRIRQFSRPGPAVDIATHG